MEIRTALYKDVSEIVALVNSAYRGEPSKAGWTTEADLLEGQRIDEKEILEIINKKNSFIELAFDKEQLLATVYLRFEEAQTCYLGMLTVRPHLQAQGVGKLLLKHSEDKAREKGCTKMRMSVLTIRETLIHFYERRGYVKTQKTFPFSAESGHIGIPKIQGLTFVEMIKTL